MLGGERGDEVARVPCGGRLARRGRARHHFFAEQRLGAPDGRAYSYRHLPADCAAHRAYLSGAFGVLLIGWRGMSLFSISLLQSIIMGIRTLLLRFPR